MENSPLKAEESSLEKEIDKGKNARLLGAVLAELKNDQTGEGRGTAPEANQLHGKKSPAESIGRVMVSGEAAPGQAEQPLNQEKAIDKRVETMDRNELLDISEQISVEGTTLRRIYETHLIGERGLRRLVGEYLRSGDIRKLLKQELLEHEIDFERDPQLRDRAKQPAMPGDNSLTSFLQKVGVETKDPKTLSAVRQANEAYRKEQTSRQIQHRRFMDIAFISIILVLLLLVIILVISRH